MPIAGIRRQDTECIRTDSSMTFAALRAMVPSHDLTMPVEVLMVQLRDPPLEDTEATEATAPAVAVAVAVAESWVADT